VLPGESTKLAARRISGATLTPLQLASPLAMVTFGDDNITSDEERR
jgi:hypothetical protein